MLDELKRDFFVSRVGFGQDQGDLQHVLAVKRHPCRPICLLERSTGGELCAAVEYADVVQAQKSPGEHVAPRRVLPVDPPVEIQHQSLKHTFQKTQVRPAKFLLHFEERERGPRVHRRIYIAEVPLVGGHLPIGVGIEIAQHEQELLLGEIEIHQRQGDRVEGEVPGRIPGVLPFVRHRDDVGVEHVKPIHVPNAAPGGIEQRMTLVLLKPLIQIEIVVLLAPQHSRKRLMMYSTLVFAQRLWRDPCIELISVGDPAFECFFETTKRIGHVRPRQTQTEGLAVTSGHVEHVVRCGLGPDFGGVHRLASAGDDVLVKRILYVRRSIGLIPEPLRIAFVLGKKQLRSSIAMEPVFAKLMVRGLNGARSNLA